MRLNDYEAAAFAVFVTHKMDMNLRLQLMKEMPEIYNTLVGRRVVMSVNLCICGRLPEACACNDDGKCAESSAIRPA